MAVSSIFLLGLEIVVVAFLKQTLKWWFSPPRDREAEKDFLDVSNSEGSVNPEARLRSHLPAHHCAGIKYWVCLVDFFVPSTGDSVIQLEKLAFVWHQGTRIHI